MKYFKLIDIIQSKEYWEEYLTIAKHNKLSDKEITKEIASKIAKAIATH